MAYQAKFMQRAAEMYNSAGKAAMMPVLAAGLTFAAPDYSSIDNKLEFPTALAGENKKYRPASGASGVKMAALDYRNIAKIIVKRYKTIGEGSVVFSKDESLGLEVEKLYLAPPDSFNGDLKEIVSEIFHNYAVRQSEKNKKNDAIRWYEKSLELEEDVRSLTGIAAVYLATKKDIKTAQGYLERASKVSPDDFMVKVLNKVISKSKPKG